MFRISRSNHSTRPFPKGIKNCRNYSNGNTLKFANNHFMKLDSDCYNTRYIKSISITTALGEITIANTISAGSDSAYDDKIIRYKSHTKAYLDLKKYLEACNSDQDE